MAQADGVVANGTGSAVRSDINNQYAALWSNHSGSTEPSSGKVAYQTWADTNSGYLKIRNAANNGWVSLFKLDGTDIHFVNLSGSTNNTVCTVTGADAIQGEANLTFDGTLKNVNTDGSAGIALSRTFSGNVASATNTPPLTFTLTDTATSNQVIASISPQGAAGTGDAFKGHMRIFTANDAGTNTERLRIENNGNVTIQDGDLVIGTAGHGISFNPYDNTDTTNGSDSNLLDDYEEGRFLPQWVGSTVNGDATYGQNKGKYTKIGHRVWCNGYTQITGYTSTAPTGTWKLNNLPFNAGSSVDNVYATGSCMLDNFAFGSINWVVTYKPADNNDMMLYYSDDGGSWAGLSATTDYAFNIIWSISYCIN